MTVTSFTREQITQFEQTLIDRNGVVFATFGDQQVSFISYGDAVKFLGEMRAQVERQEAGAAGRSSTRYAATSKGV